jgi:hypothetical protein
VGGAVVGIPEQVQREECEGGLRNERNPARRAEPVSRHDRCGDQRDPYRADLLDHDCEPDEGQVASDEALPCHGPAVLQRVQPLDSEDDGDRHQGEHADHRVPAEVEAQRGPQSRGGDQR